MLSIISQQRNANEKHSEILLHTHQDGYNFKLKEWNTCTLVGAYSCTATLENGLAVSRKVKYPPLDPRERETRIHTKTCTRMLKASLFFEREAECE